MSRYRHHHSGYSNCNIRSHKCCDASHGDEPLDFNRFLEETHPCFEEDVAEKTRAAEIRKKLERVDPSMMAERARGEALSIRGALAEVQLPQYRRRGEDYPALEEARRKAADSQREGDASIAIECDGPPGGSDGEDDSEDEDEEDLMYLMDDPELLRLENARVEAMKAQAARLENLRSLGFGRHLEVQASELEATSNGQFRGAGVVVHVYIPDSPLCASLDLFLEAKAASYMGTRFVRCRVRPDSSVATKMRIQRVPSLGCYQGGVRVAYTEDLAQFGDVGGVNPGAVLRWLEASGTLEFDPPRLDALRDGLDGMGQDRREREDDSGGEGDRDEGMAWYNCGLEGCRKSFAHNHFLTEGQGGLPPDFEKPF